ncbi:acyloxyacyl hydrolase [Mucilaginibacter calamicampi]|uniref:Acyloxyacyl hydrolase n=1 Tax=Mucilaginibacter calamicampi TaxID=1302352 RepID=A0ABW2YU39_9SPHI
MRLKSKLKLLLLLLAITSVSYAQNRNSIGANFMYGATMAATQGAYQGIGLNYNINVANSEAEWTSMLNVENITIDATLYNMGGVSGGNALTAFNPKFRETGYFGTHVALSGGLDIRLLNANGFKVLFAPGLGLLYSTKDYGTTGGVNQVMGGRLNIISSAKLKLVFPVTYNTSLQIGAVVAHSSNSNTSKPNVGLNKIESFIGITHGLSSAPTRTHAPKFNLGKNALAFEFIGGYTGQITTGFYQLNGVNLQLDKSFRKSATPIFKAGLSASFSRYVNHVLGLKVGTDLVYSSKTSPLGSATSDTARFIQTFQGNYTPVYSHVNVGVNAGVDLRLGRMVFSGSYGYFLGGYERYIYTQTGTNKFVYGRMFYSTVSAKYFITPKIALAAKSYLNNFGGVGVQVGI